MQNKMNKTILYLTGNPRKKQDAEDVLGLYGLSVETLDLNLDEIQEEDIEKIAVTSALQGAKQLGRPVITMDVGFEIDALNGFPGAYGKFVFPRLGVDGMLRLMAGKENRHAVSIEVLAYATPDGYTKTFKTVRNLEILTEPQGTGSVIDQLMRMVDEHTVNYGSMSFEEKRQWWMNGDNYYHAFAKWYLAQSDTFSQNNK